MLDACSRAALPSPCVLRSEDNARAPSLVVATVTWNESGTAVRVHVEATGQRGAALDQDLAFRDTDELEERWRSVGLTVGTLAANAVPPPSPVQPPPRAREPARPVRALRAQASLGTVAGPGFDNGPWRIGAWVRGDLALSPLPLSLFVDATHAQSAGRVRDVSGSWTTVAVGAGAFAEIDALQLRLGVRLAGTGERIGAAARDSSTGQQAGGARWVPGARAGLELLWPFQGWVGLVAASDVWWTPSPTDVLVRGAAAASSPNTGFVLRLGASASFR